MDSISNTILVGLGATATVDAWALARRRLFRVPLPDYGLVGRWFAHMPRGRFRHESIGSASPIRRERAVGWIAHYAIGVAFAAMLVLGWGTHWLQRPSPGPALTIGLLSVVAPFLLMQPAMGAGIAASRSPNPSLARLHSLATHFVFGLGLYGCAWIISSYTSGV